MVISRSNGATPTRQRIRSRRNRGPINNNTRALSTGLSLWHGQVREEYLNDLTPWSRAVKVYKEMQDDVVIGALLEAIKTSGLK